MNPRHRQKRACNTTVKAKPQPLAEGIITVSRGCLDSLDDGDLIKKSKALIEEHGITSRADLYQRIRVLYYVLNKRGLLGDVGFGGSHRWARMDHEQLLDHARRVIEEKRIRSRNGLISSEYGLYQALRGRGLLKDMVFEKDARTWRRYSDEKLLDYARGNKTEMGIESRAELKQKDSALYHALIKRGLLADLFQDRRQEPRYWSAMDDLELVEFGRAFIAEEAVVGRFDLHKKDSGLYEALRVRGLLDAIGLDKKVVKPRPRGERKKRDAKRKKKPAAKTRSRKSQDARMKRRGSRWAAMDDVELISAAKEYITSNSIPNRTALSKKLHGLYHELAKRGLLETVGLESRKPERIDESTLLQKAISFIKENSITSRPELKTANPRLYEVLQRRGLFEKVGLPIMKRDLKGMCDGDLVRLARQIIDEKSIESRTDLAKRDAPIYEELRKRGLFDEAGLRLKGIWIGMDDDGLVAYAADIIKERAIASRYQLERDDHRLYHVLWKRKLLDRIGLPSSRAPQRSWKDVDDDRLLDMAREIIKQEGIVYASELVKIDGGLHWILKKRNLLPFLGLDIGRRNWSNMEDRQIVSYAKDLIERMGIQKRMELMQKDQSLYVMLRIKGLLDQVFADIDGSIETEQVREVVTALNRF